MKKKSKLLKNSVIVEFATLNGNLISRGNLPNQLVGRQKYSMLLGWGKVKRVAASREQKIKKKKSVSLSRADYSNVNIISMFSHPELLFLLSVRVQVQSIPAQDNLTEVY